MSKTNRPTVEYLRQCFRYEDGRIYWLDRPASHFKALRDSIAWNMKFAGQEAGYLWTNRKGDKRRMVALGGKFYQRAHVVLAMHTGEWPDLTCDHRDRNSLNDKIENLRWATQTQNNANTRKPRTNKSGFKWASFHRPSGRYQSQIKLHGKQIPCGYFDTAEEAHEAAKAEHRKLFGEFSHDGKVNL